MASTTTPAAAPPTGPSADTAPRGGHRGGRRGGRGGSSGGPAGEGRGGPPRRPRGERGGGSGGGRRGSQRPQNSSTPNAEEIASRMAGAVLSGPAEPTTAAGDAASDSDADAAVCFICADPVRYSAIAPCNHVTCHICTLRMRALYKNRACAHCRTEAEWVIFSKDETKPFAEFRESDIVQKNDALGIKYDDQTICDDTTLLLRYNCPDESCDQALRGWADLHHHVRAVHHKVLCDLCSRNKKVFTHEHTLFTPPELRKHERTGDDQPGSENQSGFKGHPECGFCRQRFYSSDELFTHCRDKHERCHICDRRNPSAQQQYYIDYDALAAHFSRDHFMCADEECMEKKFVVFENEVDLKAHQLEVHPNGLSKNARRDARRIDMSTFADDRHVPDRGGGRRRRNDGRGQQEREELPIRTEQQMSRAELAYHRTLAVQSAQSTTSRTFGGQLTEPAFAARPPPPAAVRPVASMTTTVQPPARPPARPAELPAAVTSTVAAVAFPPLAPPRAVTETAAGPSRPPSSRPSPSRTPVLQVAFPPLAPPSRPPESAAGPSRTPGPDDNIRRRHAAVIDRALTLLRHNDHKLATFKTDISRFRSGALTAPALVDAFWALFDAKASELGVLIRELAELFDDDSKRRDLLRAWNDWRAANEDYPPFAGASVSAPASGGSRVLRVKNSTSRSAGSSTARQGAWGAAANVPVVTATAPVARSVNRKGPGAHAPTPWVAQGTSAGRSDEFPSLPAKAPPPPGWGPIKKKDPYAAYNGAPVPQAGAWGAGGSGGERSEEPSESEGGGQGRRKKGKGKQMLFHVGLPGGAD